jgi:hypothetical protein
MDGLPFSPRRRERMIRWFSHSGVNAIQAPESAWQHDKFADVAARGGAGGRVSAIETGTKLFITNLDFGVSSEDIKVYTLPDLHAILLPLKELVSDNLMELLPYCII